MTTNKPLTPTQQILIEHLERGATIAKGASGRWTNAKDLPNGDPCVYNAKTVDTLIRDWVIHVEDGFLAMMPERGEAVGEIVDEDPFGVNDPPPPEEDANSERTETTLEWLDKTSIVTALRKEGYCLVHREGHDDYSFRAPAGGGLAQAYFNVLVEQLADTPPVVVTADFDDGVAKTVEFDTATYDDEPPPQEQERGKPATPLQAGTNSNSSASTTGSGDPGKPAPESAAKTAPVGSAAGGEPEPTIAKAETVASKGPYKTCAEHPGSPVKATCQECLDKIDAQVKAHRDAKKAKIVEMTVTDPAVIQKMDASQKPQSIDLMKAATAKPEPKTVAWPGVGIFYDMPEAQYHAIEALSSSALRGGLLTSLAEYLEYKANPITPTADMFIGTLTHYGFLEQGDLDALELPIFEGKEKTRNNKAFRAAFEADPRTHLQSEVDAAKGAVGSLKGSTQIAHVLTGARIELSVFWIETVGDVEIRCKARLDSYTRDKHIGDLKVTGKGTGVKGWFFMRKERLLHFQLAWYRRGAVDQGLEVNDCLNILAPNCEPFGPSEVHRMPWRDIERADHIIETVALPRLASYIQNPDCWKGAATTPGGNPAVNDHRELPPWAFEDFR
jgi:hypothetical protein